MARAYIIEKEIDRGFGIFTICHSTSILNHILGRMGRKLTTLFKTVYGKQLDSKT